NGFPVSKLFKSQIIKCNEIRFPLGVSLSEDTIFLLEYVSYVSNILYRDTTYYKYLINSNSLSNRKEYDFNSNLIGFKKINEILFENFQIHDLKYYPTLGKTYLGFLIRAVNALNKGKYNRAQRIEKYKLLYSVIKIDIKRIHSDSFIKKKIYWIF